MLVVTLSHVVELPTANCQWNTIRSIAHSFLSSKCAGSSYIFWSAMSAYPYPIQSRQPEPYSQSTYEEDVKASFDDLVDPYASSYHPSSRHQTFTVGTPLSYQIPQSHQKTPSIPLPSKAHSSKRSEDQDTLYNYPPPPPQEKLESRSLWQRVQIF